MLGKCRRRPPPMHTSCVQYGRKTLVQLANGLNDGSLLSGPSSNGGSLSASNRSAETRLQSSSNPHTPTDLKTLVQLANGWNDGSLLSGPSSNGGSLSASNRSAETRLQSSSNTHTP